jgi:hypothetical protein
MNRQLRITTLAAGLGLAATSAVLLAADRQAETQRVDRPDGPAATEQRSIGSAQTELGSSVAPKVRVAITDTDTAAPNDNKTKDKINETVGGHLQLAYTVASPGYVNKGVPQTLQATPSVPSFTLLDGPGGLQWPGKDPPLIESGGAWVDSPNGLQWLVQDPPSGAEGYDPAEFFDPDVYDDMEPFEGGHDRYVQHYEGNDEYHYIHYHIDDLYPEYNYRYSEYWNYDEAGTYDHERIDHYDASLEPPVNPSFSLLDQSWHSGGLLNAEVLPSGAQQTPDVVGGLRFDQGWGTSQISGDLHLATGTFGQGFGPGSGLPIIPFQFGTFGQDMPTPMSPDTGINRAFIQFAGFTFGASRSPPPMILDTDALQLPDLSPGFQPNSFQFNPGSMQFNIQTFGPAYGLPAFNSPGVFVRPFAPMPEYLPGFGPRNDIGSGDSPHQAFINGLNGIGGFQIPVKELPAYNFSGTQLSYDLKYQVSNYTSFVQRTADSYPTYDELNQQLQLPPTAHADYTWGFGSFRFVQTTVQDSSWNFSSDYWKSYIKHDYLSTVIYDTDFTKQPAPNPDSAKQYPAGRELPEAALTLASEPRAAR